MSPAENSACTAFKKYGEVPETVPLNFTEDGVTWVASKISGAAGVLGAEAIELRNWLRCLGYAPEELMVSVARLDGWMPPPPWTAYRALIACYLLALDKRQGVRLVGIGEMLRRDLAKIVMRAAGY